MQRAAMIDRLNNDYSEKFDFLSKERIAKFRRESYARGDVIYAQKFKFYHSAARQSEAKLLRKRQRIYL